MFAIAPSFVLADAVVSKASSFPTSTEQSKPVALAPITIPLKNSPKPISFGRPILFYTNNQPFNQPFILDHGQIFATIEDAASALRLKIERQGDMICISGNGFSENTCPANNSNAGLVYINGKAFPESALLNTGKTWVDVSALAHSLGYRFIFNRQTEIADLFLPAVPSVLRQPPPAVDQSQNNNPIIRKDIKESEDEDELPSLKVESITENLLGGLPPSIVYLGPLTAPTKVTYRTAPVKHPLFFFRLHRFMNPLAGIDNCDIYFSFKITNTGGNEVKDIVATITYLDGDGDSMTVAPLPEIYNLGNLEPGQFKAKQYYGYNLSLISVWPHFQLSWTDKKGKKKSTEDLKLQLADSTILPSGHSRPEYAKNYPDAKYPTAGEIALVNAIETNFSKPVIPIPLHAQEITNQTMGDLKPSPASATNTGIPIGTPANSTLLGTSANATLPYSSANATLPYNPVSSIPLVFLIAESGH